MNLSYWNAPAYRYFGNGNFRITPLGDIEVRVTDLRNAGMSGIGETWWQNLITQGVGAGLSIWSTQQQAQFAAQQQYAAAIARFWEVYNVTFPGLQQIMDALSAQTVPASQVSQAVPAAQQIMAVWSQTTAQLSFANNAQAAVGVTLGQFIAECNTALGVKMDRIRQLVAAYVASPTTPPEENGVTPLEGGFFNMSLPLFGFDVPVWALAAGGAILLFKR